MSSFPDSLGPESQPAGLDRHFADPESVEQSVDVSPIFINNNAAFSSEDDVFGFESNGNPSTFGVFVESNGPILPPPSDMQEEGFLLREWRLQNAILLEQKEKREKEILSEIIGEANEYKAAFHEKRKVTCDNNKNNNREKEKLFLANQEKFHKEADKNYWKAIAELIPNEVPAIEKKKRGKEDEKKPSVIVIQGPKPGKRTDLARMRQVLVKLKHNTPTHLKLTTPPATTTITGGTAAVAATPEALVAA